MTLKMDKKNYITSKKVEYCSGCIHIPEREMCIEHVNIDFSLEKPCTWKKTPPEVNENTIEDALRQLGGMAPRSSITTLSKLPRTTVYDVLKRLEKKKIVRRTPETHRINRGRPATYWILNEMM